MFGVITCICNNCGKEYEMLKASRNGVTLQGSIAVKNVKKKLEKSVWKERIKSKGLPEKLNIPDMEIIEFKHCPLPFQSEGIKLA